MMEILGEAQRAELVATCEKFKAAVETPRLLTCLCRIVRVVPLIVFTYGR